MVHLIECEGIGNSEDEAIEYARTVLESGLGEGWYLTLQTVEYLGMNDGIPLWCATFICEQPN